MNPFERLSDLNKVLINFAYYVEQPDGELTASYLEQLEDVLADGFIDGETLGEARQIIERLTEIVKLTSDRIYIHSKEKLNSLYNTPPHAG